MARLVFYTTAHGFGHSVRIAAVISELITQHPSWEIYLRTSAPRAIFSGLRPSTVQIHSVAIDTGVVEGDNTLTVDAEDTLAGVERLYQEHRSIIGSETAFLCEIKADLVISDIPYLAGNIAAAADTRCLGLANFTWDWIYEPYFEQLPRYAYLRDFVRDGYSRMDMLLQLPFGHAVSSFAHVEPVHLVARRGKLKRASIREMIGIGKETRRIIFSGMRSELPLVVLARIASANPDLIFLTLQQVAPSGPDNLRQITLGTDLTFPDVLRAADVVVSKLGYGLLADSIANRTALLFPPRFGFREDELLRHGAKEYLRSQEIPLADFAAGNWGPYLRSLLEMPARRSTCPTDGAEDCAKWIARLVAG